jgi:hypothetical protein
VRHPFLRTLAGASAVATDPNFENVTLLLHGDGTNGGQNNTFVDGSTNNFTITRNGNTTQGTFSPYGANWSNFFDGTGDYLSAPDSTAFAFGTGDFTIEYWIYAISFSNTQTIFDTRASGGVTGYSDYFGNTGSFNLFLNNTTIYTSASNVALNTWTHIAVSRSGTSIRVFINGTQSGSTVTNTTNLSDQKCLIGVNRNFVSYHNGYISNLRVLKGTAQYTSNFTPSTTPLTAITNTSLLTCQSNRFRDASTNNFTITRNGDVSVQRFSPFSPTAAYAAGTIGGSGYFDGTGDNLSISSATGLCDFAAGQAFTFQVWLYRLGTGSMIFIQGGANTFQVTIISSGGGWTYGKSGVSDLFYGVGAAPVGAWTHCTLCRDTSNRTRMWINGVSVASSTSDTFAFNTAATYIGSNNTSSSSFVQGYLSDMRIVKGQALYDPTSAANIAVPTAPLTAVTNTSFLLNFTNASVRDNAMMADLETVGNAQISTTVKKYGTGSLAFDGTGDYLVSNSAATDLYALGSGNFTIEFWLYLNSTQGNNIIDFRPSGTEGFYPTIYLSANSIRFFTNTGDRIVGTTLSNLVWYHIALCKSGTATKLFVDGTQTGSTYTDSNTYLGAVGRPFIGASGRNVNTNFVNGYIDDLRITKGVARYTATFTPPTAALPDL